MKRFAIVVLAIASVVVKVKENKVKEYKDLKDLWTKVREKPEFLKYVRENVEAYSNSLAPVAGSP